MPNKKHITIRTRHNKGVSVEWTQTDCSVHIDTTSHAGVLLRDKINKAMPHPEVQRMDKELDILHVAMSKLYNIDSAVPIIKKALADIDKLKKAV